MKIFYIIGNSFAKKYIFSIKLFYSSGFSLFKFRFWMVFCTGLDKVFLAPQDSASVNTSPDSLHKRFTYLQIYII
jgi:hypothetical protein